MIQTQDLYASLTIIFCTTPDLARYFNFSESKMEQMDYLEELNDIDL